MPHVLLVKCASRIHNFTSSLLHQRAGRIGRAKCPFARNRGEYLVVVPRIFAFLRRLDLHEPEIMHHQIVLAQPAVAGENILDRLFPHLRWTSAPSGPSPRICTPWLTGSSTAASRRWRWSPPGCTGSRASSSWAS